MSCKTIIVFGNKGGVGKTIVAVNLATALALAGRKVLLIDLDFRAGQDMARMLLLTPRYGIADVVNSPEVSQDPMTIKQQVIKHSSGLDFIPAVKNVQQLSLITATNLKSFLKNAGKIYDYILVDGGGVFNEMVVTSLDNSNLILLVATPDILAVYQIKNSLDILQNMHFPLKMIKLILNRSESRGSVAWQEIRSALPCEIFSHIPSDGKLVGMALNRGVPVVIDSPRSPVSEAFMRLVNILDREDIYVVNTESDKPRAIGDIGKQDEYLKKKSGTRALAMGGETFVQIEDATDILKRKIHDKLVERLNLDGITADTLGNERSMTKLKKSAEELIMNLILEETGGKMTSHEERAALVKDIINEALGLGPLEDLLADPDVSDIMVNSRNMIYVENGGKLILTNKKFVSDEKLRAVIDRIIAPLGRRIDESTPMVDARLPDGSRINAIIPPLSLAGPMLTIRKFGQERLEIHDLLNKYHSLSQSMADFLHSCVLGRRNIIVSGGTGSGKTTLLNVISEFIPDNERILTIEDAAELKLKKSHWGRLESRPRNVEGKGEITIRDLFINSLRMRPDRIVIGECRGPEILDMLQAMNTGHDGSMTTLHANSTRDVLIRMHAMILLSGIELPVRAINEMVSSAIDIIVHINRYSDGSRRITGIAEVIGVTEDQLVNLKDIFIFKQKGVDQDGKVVGDFEPTGYVPQCYEEFATRGLPIDIKIFSK